MSPETAKPEDWSGIFDELTKKIKGEIGESIISNLECNFTTTNPVTLTTSQISIMSAMKNYFKYELVMIECGIRSITLEGSLEDWKKIKSKFEYFLEKEFDLYHWIIILIPIIDKIIETKSYYDQNQAITEEIRDFWKDMIRINKGFGCQPGALDGWIIDFIPDLSKEFPIIYNELKEDEIPDQIISCPVKLIFQGILSKTEYDCSLESGFYGMVQDETTYNIKPVIGYALVVEDEKVKKL